METGRYTILVKNIEENGEEWSYYYIAGDVTIDDYIKEEIIEAEGKIYIEDIKNAEIDKTVYIPNNGSFTTELILTYAMQEDETKTDKYTELTKMLVIKDKSENTVTVPKGTEIVMIQNGVYYSYIVEEDIAEINLSNFKKISDGTIYPSIFNITDNETNPNISVSTNEVTGYNTYDYEEIFRFIINFSNCISYVADGGYYVAINIADGGTSIGEEQEENAKNMLQIVSRSYIYNGQVDKEKYEQDGIININGTLTLSQMNKNIAIKEGTELGARLKLVGENGEEVEIPEGSKITINGVDIDYLQNGVAEARIIESLTNSAVTKDLNITIDMSGVLEKNVLPVGTYTLEIDLKEKEENLIKSVAQNTAEIPIEIINYDTISAIKAEVIDNGEYEENKLQLIQSGEAEERTIKLEYEGNLEEPYIKITMLEKTGEFTYEATKNSSNILSKIEGLEVTESTIDSAGKEITISFGDNVSVGTYRVLFELYDKYGSKKTESIVNFIVY